MDGSVIPVKDFGLRVVKVKTPKTGNLLCSHKH
jgi:hypothetical protein